MIGDLSVIGPQSTIRRYIAAAGTAIKAGEPLHRVGNTQSSGEASVNEMVLAAADTPVIGTHQLGGVAIENSKNGSAGTTLAQFLNCACPIPHAGRIRGGSLVTTDIDTLSELRGVIGDFTLIDYNATGGSDGGEKYTIITNATADTGGLEIVDGSVEKLTVDCVVMEEAYRSDIS